MIKVFGNTWACSEYKYYFGCSAHKDIQEYIEIRDISAKLELTKIIQNLIDCQFKRDKT